MDCIFCQIVAGKVPAETVYQDEEVIAFPDINAQAPVHMLIIPRKHIPSLAHLSEDDTPRIGHMVNIANQLAKREDILESGYRLAINCGGQGGQMVPHLHMHLLGGRQMSGQLG